MGGPDRMPLRGSLPAERCRRTICAALRDPIPYSIRWSFEGGRFPVVVLRAYDRIRTASPTFTSADDLEIDGFRGRPSRGAPHLRFAAFGRTGVPGSAEITGNQRIRASAGPPNRSCTLYESRSHNRTGELGGGGCSDTGITRLQSFCDGLFDRFDSVRVSACPANIGDRSAMAAAATSARQMCAYHDQENRRSAMASMSAGSRSVWSRAQIDQGSTGPRRRFAAVLGTASRMAWIPWREGVATTAACSRSLRRGYRHCDLLFLALVW